MDNAYGGDPPKGIKIIGLDSENGITSSNPHLYIRGVKHKLSHISCRGLQAASYGIYLDYCTDIF